VKRWLLLGLGLGAYALSLIATAPASLIDAALQAASANRLRLAEVRGTLWSGTGQIELRDEKRRTSIAKNVTWQVLPAYLLRGELRCEVELDQAGKPFPVTISAARIEVADADIALPAAALGLGVPELTSLGLLGEVLLHVDRLSFAPGAIHGNATLQWRAAGSAFTRVAPLGDYELRFEGEGGAAHASLHTLSGALQLEGAGNWKAGGNSVFQGTARVAPQHLQQLAPLLRLFAIERGEGLFDLQLVF
jgi:general secretion pathway protein N